MGLVYLAEHPLLGRRVAIKVMSPAHSARQDALARFFNEARAMGRMRHPSLIEVFDFGKHTDGSVYLVMELLHGETLGDRLDRVSRLDAPEAVRIVQHVAQGMEVAHRGGLVHRDLKPENVYLVRAETAGAPEPVKILDFGVAKLASGSVNRAVTQPGMLLGTPLFMSPEQCRGSGDVDWRSDIYSLGCVLYTMLAGHAPFPSDDMREIVVAHVAAEPPEIKALVPELSPALSAVVMKCLAKEPKDRVQSMALLAEALAATPEGSPAELSSSSTSTKGLMARTLALPDAAAGHEGTTLSRAASEITAVPDEVAAPRVRSYTKTLVAVGASLSALVIAYLGSTMGHSQDPPAHAAATATGLVRMSGAPHAPYVQLERMTRVPFVPATPPPAPPPAHEPAAPQTITVHLKNARAGLTVRIDGHKAELPLTLPADGALHDLRFEHPKLMPESHRLRADRDQTVTLRNTPALFLQ